MSNKKKAASGKGGETSALVPKLRFPEFRDAGEWELKRLGTQGDFLSSLTGKTADDFDIGPAKFIPYMNVFSNTFTDVRDLRSVNVTDDESQNSVVKGDLFFTVSSETQEDAGMSSVLLEDIDNCYLNSFCALFRFDGRRSPNIVFLGHMLRSGSARQHLSRGAQGATRYNISKAVFRTLPILMPTLPEQQKIAECLSSVDDLIAAQAWKVDALKTHKKGLMRQLFPGEGETVPRLRFPEFRDAGDWEEKLLQELFVFKQGLQVPVGKQFTAPDTNMVRFIRIIDVTQAFEPERYIEDPGTEYHVTKNELFMIRYGTPGVVSIGFEGVIANNLFRIVPKFNIQIFTKFFFYLFKNKQEYIQNLSGSSSMPAINFSTLNNLSVTFPAIPEQQKIASCLTFLDELIAAETQKLDVIKTHKKGLMQQLFPSPEDREA